MRLAGGNGPLQQYAGGCIPDIDHGNHPHDLLVAQGDRHESDLPALSVAGGRRRAGVGRRDLLFLRLEHSCVRELNGRLADRRACARSRKFQLLQLVGRAGSALSTGPVTPSWIASSPLRCRVPTACRAAAAARSVFSAKRALPRIQHDVRRLHVPVHDAPVMASARRRHGGDHNEPESPRRPARGKSAA